MSAAHEPAATVPPSRALAEHTAYVGTVIFVASWALLFAGLLFACGWIRLRALSWPGTGAPRLPRVLPVAATAAIVGSSVAVQTALARVRRGRGSAILLEIALAFGLAFVGLQLLTWRAALAAGLRPATSLYGAVFFVLTGFHGLHALVGAGALAALAARARRGAFTAERHAPLRLWSLYLHLVCGAWLAVYVAVFLL